MNKNVIIVGAIAVGLYLLSQGNKPKKAVAKKKAVYIKPKPKKAVAKKKTAYNKWKIKKAVAKKKIAPTPTKPQKKNQTQNIIFMSFTRSEDRIYLFIILIVNII